MQFESTYWLTISGTVKGTLMIRVDMVHGGTLDYQIPERSDVGPSEGKVDIQVEGVTDVLCDVSLGLPSVLRELMGITDLGDNPSITRQLFTDSLDDVGKVLTEVLSFRLAEYGDGADDTIKSIVEALITKILSTEASLKVERERAAARNN